MARIFLATLLLLLLPSCLGADIANGVYSLSPLRFERQAPAHANDEPICYTDGTNGDQPVCHR